MQQEKNTVIIAPSGMFWTGPGWSIEYPDAMLCAEKEAVSIMRWLKRESKSAYLRAVSNYGTEGSELIRIEGDVCKPYWA